MDRGGLARVRETNTWSRGNGTFLGDGKKKKEKRKHQPAIFFVSERSKIARRRASGKRPLAKVARPRFMPAND